MAARSVSAINDDIAAVRAAKTKLITRGQSEGHDGTSVSRVSLTDLNNELSRLEHELARASGRSGVTFSPTLGVG